MTLTPHTLRTARHTTGYLATGPEDGPLLIFCHGWPELAYTWRHQLTALGALGFRCVAPDMRGYGASTVHPAPSDYRREEAVADMLELLDSLGRDAAVWIGHDWGAPVVWNIASHHPERVVALAALCVPHLPAGQPGPMELIDRDLYPAAEYPYGQWDYQVHYLKAFDEVTAQFEADLPGLIAALFRSGSPRHVQRPAPTATVTRDGGWFGGGPVPDLPLDPAVLTPQDHAVYVAAFTRTGMAGANNWYVNARADAEYNATAVNDGRIAVPVLFVHARYDATCETVQSRLAEPMRATCSNLTETIIDAGHWIAEERPAEVNDALARWLATAVPGHWPS